MHGALLQPVPKYTISRGYFTWGVSPQQIGYRKGYTPHPPQAFIRLLFFAVSLGSEGLFTVGSLLKQMKQQPDSQSPSRLN